MDITVFERLGEEELKKLQSDLESYSSASEEARKHLLEMKLDSARQDRFAQILDSERLETLAVVRLCLAKAMIFRAIKLDENREKKNVKKARKIARDVNTLLKLIEDSRKTLNDIPEEVRSMTAMKAAPDEDWIEKNLGSIAKAADSILSKDKSTLVPKFNKAVTEATGILRKSPPDKEALEKAEPHIAEALGLAQQLHDEPELMKEVHDLMVPFGKLILEDSEKLRKEGDYDFAFRTAWRGATLARAMRVEDTKNPDDFISLYDKSIAAMKTALGEMKDHANMLRGEKKEKEAVALAELLLKRSKEALREFTENEVDFKPWQLNAESFLEKVDEVTDDMIVEEGEAPSEKPPEPETPAEKPEEKPEAKPEGDRTQGFESPLESQKPEDKLEGGSTQGLETPQESQKPEERHSDDEKKKELLVELERALQPLTSMNAKDPEAKLAEIGRRKELFGLTGYVKNIHAAVRTLTEIEPLLHPVTGNHPTDKDIKNAQKLISRNKALMLDEDIAKSIPTYKHVIVFMSDLLKNMIAESQDLEFAQVKMVLAFVRHNAQLFSLDEVRDSAFNALASRYEDSLRRRFQQLIDRSRLLGVEHIKETADIIAQKGIDDKEIQEALKDTFENIASFMAEVRSEQVMYTKADLWSRFMKDVLSEIDERMDAYPEQAAAASVVLKKLKDMLKKRLG
ncbi:hypothetical protein KY362_07055 [Candidatus Woesearchaeota archaeon]|nr:hypothetical protein [Candidatus Woesearchaeota archaeon]